MDLWDAKKCFRGSMNTSEIVQCYVYHICLGSRSLSFNWFSKRSVHVPKITGTPDLVNPIHFSETIKKLELQKACAVHKSILERPSQSQVRAELSLLSVLSWPRVLFPSWQRGDANLCSQAAVLVWVRASRGSVAIVSLQGASCNPLF